jgi:hypothetical protein
LQPTDFRQDRWLRTSATHLATWSLAALVLDVLLRAAGKASQGTGIATFVVVVAASLLNSMTTERRVAKMLGPAGKPVYAGAGRMWLLVFATLASASAALFGAGRADAIVTLWLFGAGTAFLFWGRTIGFSWYAGAGLGMMLAGAVDSWMSAAGGPVGLWRILVLGLALPATAIATNRRYLWLRP